MSTLNEIPECLRDSETDSGDWTPAQGLVNGALSTVLVGVILASGLCVVTDFAPRLVRHPFLAIAVGTCIGWILFEVMHRSAGMVSHLCTLGVIAVFVLIIGAQYFVLLLHVAHATDPPSSLWAHFSMAVFALGNLPYWTGITVATLMCKDGGGRIHDLVDLFMVNVLTGRRW